VNRQIWGQGFQICGHNLADITTPKPRMDRCDRCRIFKLSGGIDQKTRYVRPLFSVKRSRPQGHV